jgi:hypothetical protein
MNDVPFCYLSNVAELWHGSTYGDLRGHAVAKLGETLCYKPEGRGF